MQDQATGVPQTQQKTPTLEEYAAGVGNLNYELQRQNAAYGHFRDVVAKLRSLAKDPSTKFAEQLPFIIVRFPQDGDTPGEMRIDLNTMEPQALATLLPVFETLERDAADGLLRAWDNLHKITDATKPIIQSVKQAG